MNDPKALPFSESILRLALGIAALVLAAWMSHNAPAPLKVSLPKPGLVVEW